MINNSGKIYGVCKCNIRVKCDSICKGGRFHFGASVGRVGMNPASVAMYPHLKALYPNNFVFSAAFLYYLPWSRGRISKNPEKRHPQQGTAPINVN